MPLYIYNLFEEGGHLVALTNNKPETPQEKASPFTPGVVFDLFNMPDPEVEGTPSMPNPGDRRLAFKREEEKKEE